MPKLQVDTDQSLHLLNREELTEALVQVSAGLDLFDLRSVVSEVALFSDAGEPPPLLSAQVADGRRLFG